MSDQSSTLIVTGGSGKLGRLVIEQLLDVFSGRIIATTRTPARLHDLQARGVVVREADFDDPPTLDRAFDGGERLLLVSTDAHDVPGRRVKQHRNAIEAATRAAVKHVVYTSLTKPEPGSPMVIAPDHYATEQTLARSPLGWTVLRNNLYADLLLEFLPKALQTGRLVAAAGSGAVSWVTRNDVARTAAAALCSKATDRSILNVTGPEAMTYTRLAEVTAEVSGRPVQYIDAAPADIRKGMTAGRVPEHVIEVLLGFQLAAARGDLAVTSSTVQELTGRIPQTAAEFLRGHARLFDAVTQRRAEPEQ